MRIKTLLMILLASAGAGAQTLAPTVSNVTSSSFTLSWTTTQRLNTQVLYSTGGSASTRQANWTLATAHTATVTGLAPGTAYTVQAESSYYSSPDLFSPVLTVTTASNSGASGGSGAPPPTPTGMSTPVISGITASSFTVTWTTTQALNSQLHFGIAGPTQAVNSWVLATQHAITVTGLVAGTSYSVQAESSYYSNPDLRGPLQTVTTAGSGTTPPPPPPPVNPPPPATSGGSRLFPSSAADWLYSAPTGTGINISGVTSGMRFDLNTHAQGFDYPVEYTDGSHGCTNFTDTLQYQYTDRYCVPNPANGYFPSLGGWGANDGHLVVVNTATGEYYDFWKLYTNAAGQPTSTNVGGVFKGLLSGNGTPGTTAADISGLAGDILPGELDCETCLNHALSVIVPASLNSNLIGHQAPATHTDGGASGAIFREGAKIRLDPSVAVDALQASTAVKAILRALQLYGGVITDQTGGSQISFYTALATAPDLTGLNLAGQHLWIYY